MFKIPEFKNNVLPDGWDDAKADRVIRKSISKEEELTQEEYEWLKNLVPPQVNPCGECKVCCITPAIEEDKIDGEVLTKPKAACEQCQNLTDGKCSVYQNRPEVCSSYLCLYSMGLTDIHPMEHQCAWSFQTNTEGQGLLIGHAKSVEAVLSSEQQVNMILEACNTGKLYAVTIRDSQKAVSIECSSFEAELALIDQSDPTKQRLVFDSIRSIGRGIPFLQHD